MKDNATGAALELREAMDAYGNVTRTTYGNGAATTRAFDPKTGRPTDIDTASRSGTKIQDNAYAWRSDGLLASRASHVGGRNAKLEEFFHDPLGRLDGAVTKLNGSGYVTRKLSWTYDNRGNLKSKASSVGADMETTVSAYHYDDDARPNRLSRAAIGGRDHKIHHDTEGNVTRYECKASTGCGDDTHIAWNGRNLPGGGVGWNGYDWAGPTVLRPGWRRTARRRGVRGRRILVYDSLFGRAIIKHHIDAVSRSETTQYTPGTSR